MSASTFPAHTVADAPEASRPLLEGIEKSFGGVPNLFAKFASSPALLEAYGAISKIFGSATGFDASERQVVAISASVENGCTYCVAAHSTIAGMERVPADVIAALREGTPLPEKLEALRTFTLHVVRNRGWVPEEELQAFLDAGYTQQHVLDVVLGVAMKTISNYANHITGPELDANFQPQAWAAPASAGA